MHRETPNEVLWQKTQQVVQRLLRNPGLVVREKRWLDRLRG